MSYSIPKAKNNVYFTRNLTEKTRRDGEMLLGYYFRNSKISKPPFYPVTNFQGLILFLDENYPTFIESLGDYLRSVPIDKMIQSMKDAASLGLTYYPRPSTFSNAIMANSGVSIVGAIGDGLAESASEIGSLSLGALKIMVVVAIVFGGLYFYTVSGGKLPEINLGKK